jgi:hypothetical protein
LICHRHPGGNRGPINWPCKNWIPAFAGMREKEL